MFHFGQSVSPDKRDMHAGSTGDILIKITIRKTACGGVLADTKPTSTPSAGRLSKRLVAWAVFGKPRRDASGSG